MNKLVLISFLAACLVALAEGGREPNRQFELNVKKGGPQEHYKASLGKAWESRDGKWSAGTYVQQTKNRYPGGQNIRDTQAGFEVKGEFKG